MFQACICHKRSPWLQKIFWKFLTVLRKPLHSADAHETLKLFKKAKRLNIKKAIIKKQSFQNLWKGKPKNERNTEIGTFEQKSLNQKKKEKLKKLIKILNRMLWIQKKTD